MTKVKASIEDLKLERWLRRRESRNIVWTTKDGCEIPIIDMTDKHIDNAIKLKQEMEAKLDAIFGI